MIRPGRKYYGKYRGVVLNNVDPLLEGRLLVQVPDVAGLAPTTWATPCVPIAGIQYGMVAIPINGSGVWVEFEHGDPKYPIWVGCFWGSAAEIPALHRRTPPGVPAITLQTPSLNGITISDLPGAAGGIVLQSGTTMIQISQDGIKLIGLKIDISGIVDINLGALKVI